MTLEGGGTGEQVIALKVTADVSEVVTELNRLQTRIQELEKSQITLSAKDNRAGSRGTPRESASFDVKVNGKDVVSQIQKALDGHEFKIIIDQNHFRSQIEAALKDLPISVSGVVGTSNASVGSGQRPNVELSLEARQAIGKSGSIQSAVGYLVDTFKKIGRDLGGSTTSESLANIIVAAGGTAGLKNLAPTKGSEKARQEAAKRVIAAFDIKDLETAKQMASEIGQLLDSGKDIFPLIGKISAQPMAQTIGKVGDSVVETIVQVGEHTNKLVKEAQEASTQVQQVLQNARFRTQRIAPFNLNRSSNSPASLSKAQADALKEQYNREIVGLVGYRDSAKPEDRPAITRQIEALKAKRDDLVVGTSSGRSTVATPEEAMADIIANQQLGVNRANVRLQVDYSRLRGNVNGVGINLGPWAVSAQNADLYGFYINPKTGEIGRAVPEGPQGSLERDASERSIRERFRRSKMVTLPEGSGEDAGKRVKALSPRDLVKLAVQSLYGDEGVAFLESDSVKAEMNKSFSYGSRIHPPAAPPNREGRAGRGFQHLAAAGPASIVAGIREYEAAMEYGDRATGVANASLNAEDNRIRVAAGAGLLKDSDIAKLIGQKTISPGKADLIRRQLSMSEAFPESNYKDDLGRTRNRLVDHLLETKQIPDIFGDGTNDNPGLYGLIAKQAQEGNYTGTKSQFVNKRLRDLKSLLTNGASTDIKDAEIASMLGVGSLTPEQAAQYRTPSPYIQYMGATLGWLEEGTRAAAMGGGPGRAFLTPHGRMLTGKSSEDRGPFGGRSRSFVDRDADAADRKTATKFLYPNPTSLDIEQGQLETEMFGPKRRVKKDGKETEKGGLVDVIHDVISGWMTKDRKSSNENPAREKFIQESTQRAQRILKERFGRYYTGDPNDPWTEASNDLASKPNPNEAWKVHLSVSSENQDQVEDYLDKYLEEEWKKPSSERRAQIYKRGNNGGQTGKDFTVYSGSKEQVDALAQDLSRNLAGLLEVPHGDALKSDISLAPNVVGRFVAGGKWGRGEPVPGMLGDEYPNSFHQYGAPGHPILDRDMQNLVFDSSLQPSSGSKTELAVGLAPSKKEAVARFRQFRDQLSSEEIAKAGPAEARISEIEKRIDQIKATRKAALDLLAGGPDETVAARDAVAASGAPADVIKTALELLETRTPATAGKTLIAASPSGRRGVKTGDQIRQIAADAALAAGPLPAPEEKNFASVRELMGRGDRDVVPPPRGPAGPGGTQGFGETSGAVRVIIAGQEAPVEIAWGPNGGGSGGGPESANGLPYGASRDSIRESVAKDKARAKFQGNRADFRLAGSKAAQEAFGREVERIRRNNPDVTDAQLKRAAREEGLGAVSSIFFGEEESSGSGGPGVSALKNRNDLRRRLGLEPLAARTPEYYEQVDEADQRGAELMAKARRAERGIPKRGFTASVTDIFANIGGYLDEQVSSVSRYQREGTQLRSVLARGPAIKQEAADSSQEYEKAVSNRNAAKAAVDEKIASGGRVNSNSILARTLKQTEKDLATVTNRYETAQTALKSYNNELEDQTKRVDEAGKALPSIGKRFAAFGIGGIAAGGAFAVGNIIAKIAGEILKIGEEAIAPVIERTLGYQQTTVAKNSEISESIQKFGGRGLAGFAAVAAGTGISGATFRDIAPAITEVSSIEAGNKALQKQLDLLHTWENDLKQGKSGVVRPTGGFFNTGIFGVTPTAELIQKEIGSMPELAPEDLSVISNLNEMKRQAQEAKDAGQENFQYQNGGPRTPLMSPDEAIKTANAGLAKFSQQISISEEKIKFWNDAAEKAGLGENVFSRNGNVAETVKSFREAGMNPLADELEKHGFSVKGATSGQNALDILTKIAINATKQSSSVLLETMAPGIQANEWLRAKTLNRALTENIPMQSGIKNILNPLPNAEQIQRLLPGEDVSDLQKMATADATTYKSYADQAKAFVAEHLPNEAEKFSKALDNASGYAKQIADLKLGLAAQSAANSAASYANQYRIATRSLEDAKGLAGQITDQNGQNLGIYQRQSFELQRQSQILGQQLQQRQINFSLAQAGFMAVGQTSAERSAIIEEAKIKAAYEQQQLDISKEQTSIGTSVFNIQAGRSVTDLTESLNELVRNRQLQISTEKANQQIDILTRRMDDEIAKVNTILSAAQGRVAEMDGVIAQLIATTADALAIIENNVIKTFTDTYNRISEIIGIGIVTTDVKKNGYNDNIVDQYISPVGSGTFEGNVIEDKPQLATGVLFDTTGPTDITVGEAGSETVAVLRNPRQMLLGDSGGGAGGNVINISINNPTVRSDQDLRDMALVVEQSISRKLALMGVRPIN